MQNFLRTSGSSERESAIDALGRFGERGEEGRAGFFSNEVAMLYGPGKESFDSLCADMNNEDIPLHLRSSVIETMAHNLLVCANGSVSNMIMAARDLRFTTCGLKNYAKRAREALLEQVIREFA